MTRRSPPAGQVWRASTHTAGRDPPYSQAMPNYRRARVPGGSFFFTVVTAGRQRVLTDEPVRLALREAIQGVRRDRPFQVDGWVLLPDHMHAIWTLPASDHDYATRWRLIKARVTRQLGDAYRHSAAMTPRPGATDPGSLWQHRYWEHWLRDDVDVQRHLDYLHFNPVKHGLVSNAIDWPWSSFHRFVAAGMYPRDWGMA
ncbi:REP-associated tyrosine transposase [Roseateles sp. LKC17W]|uniref:Transposase n=1 Tax=Pelomonas margarita TaxID=3299031 RepID=A0ABW7FQ92_9BURK